MGVVDDLAQAREAYERRDWMAAYDALSAADPSALDGEDFARLGHDGRPARPAQRLRPGPAARLPGAPRRG